MSRKVGKYIKKMVKRDELRKNLLLKFPYLSDHVLGEVVNDITDILNASSEEIGLEDFNEEKLKRFLQCYSPIPERDLRIVKRIASRIYTISKFFFQGIEEYLSKESQEWVKFVQKMGVISQEYDHQYTSLVPRPFSFQDEKEEEEREKVTTIDVLKFYELSRVLLSVFSTFNGHRSCLQLLHLLFKYVDYFDISLRNLTSDSVPPIEIIQDLEQEEDEDQSYFTSSSSSSSQNFENSGYIYTVEHRNYEEEQEQDEDEKPIIDMNDIFFEFCDGDLSEIFLKWFPEERDYLEYRFRNDHVRNYFRLTRFVSRKFILRDISSVIPDYVASSSTTSRKEQKNIEVYSHPYTNNIQSLGNVRIENCRFSVKDGKFVFTEETEEGMVKIVELFPIPDMVLEFQYYDLGDGFACCTNPFLNFANHLVFYKSEVILKCDIVEIRNLGFGYLQVLPFRNVMNEGRRGGIGDDSGRSHYFYLDRLIYFDPEDEGVSSQPFRDRNVTADWMGGLVQHQQESVLPVLPVGHPFGLLEFIKKKEEKEEEEEEGEEEDDEEGERARREVRFFRGYSFIGDMKPLSWYPVKSKKFEEERYGIILEERRQQQLKKKKKKYKPRVCLYSSLTWKQICLILSEIGSMELIQEFSKCLDNIVQFNVHSYDPIHHPYSHFSSFSKSYQHFILNLIYSHQNGDDDQQLLSLIPKDVLVHKIVPFISDLEVLFLDHDYIPKLIVLRNYEHLTFLYHLEMKHEQFLNLNNCEEIWKMIFAWGTFKKWMTYGKLINSNQLSGFPKEEEDRKLFETVYEENGGGEQLVGIGSFLTNVFRKVFVDDDELPAHPNNSIHIFATRLLQSEIMEVFSKIIGMLTVGHPKYEEFLNRFITQYLQPMIRKIVHQKKQQQQIQKNCVSFIFQVLLHQHDRENEKRSKLRVKLLNQLFSSVPKVIEKKLICLSHGRIIMDLYERLFENDACDELDDDVIRSSLLTFDLLLCISLQNSSRSLSSSRRRRIMEPMEPNEYTIVENEDSHVKMIRSRILKIVSNYLTQHHSTSPRKIKLFMAGDRHPYLIERKYYEVERIRYLSGNNNNSRSEKDDFFIEKMEYIKTFMEVTPEEEEEVSEKMLLRMFLSVFDYLAKTTSAEFNMHYLGIEQQQKSGWELCEVVDLFKLFFRKFIFVEGKKNKNIFKILDFKPSSSTTTARKYHRTGPSNKKPKVDEFMYWLTCTSSYSSFDYLQESSKTTTKDIRLVDTKLRIVAEILRLFDGDSKKFNKSVFQSEIFLRNMIRFCRSTLFKKLSFSSCLFRKLYLEEESEEENIVRLICCSILKAFKIYQFFTSSFPKISRKMKDQDDKNIRDLVSSAHQILKVFEESEEDGSEIQCSEYLIEFELIINKYKEKIEKKLKNEDEDNKFGITAVRILYYFDRQFSKRNYVKNMKKFSSLLVSMILVTDQMKNTMKMIPVSEIMKFLKKYKEVLVFGEEEVLSLKSYFISIVDELSGNEDNNDGFASNNSWNHYGGWGGGRNLGGSHSRGFSSAFHDSKEEEERAEEEMIDSQREGLRLRVWEALVCIPDLVALPNFSSPALFSSLLGLIEKFRNVQKGNYSYRRSWIRTPFKGRDLMTSLRKVFLSLGSSTQQQKESASKMIEISVQLIPDENNQFIDDILDFLLFLWKQDKILLLLEDKEVVDLLNVVTAHLKPNSHLNLEKCIRLVHQIFTKASPEFTKKTANFSIVERTIRIFSGQNFNEVGVIYIDILKIFYAHRPDIFENENEERLKLVFREINKVYTTWHEESHVKYVSSCNDFIFEVMKSYVKRYRKDDDDDEYSGLYQFFNVFRKSMSFEGHWLDTWLYRPKVITRFESEFGIDEPSKYMISSPQPSQRTKKRNKKKRKKKKNENENGIPKSDFKFTFSSSGRKNESSASCDEEKEEERVVDNWNNNNNSSSWNPGGRSLISEVFGFKYKIKKEEEEKEEDKVSWSEWSSSGIKEDEESGRSDNWNDFGNLKKEVAQKQEELRRQQQQQKMENQSEEYVDNVVGSLFGGDFEDGWSKQNFFGGKEEGEKDEDEEGKEEEEEEDEDNYNFFSFRGTEEGKEEKKD